MKHLHDETDQMCSDRLRLLVVSHSVTDYITNQLPVITVRWLLFIVLQKLGPVNTLHIVVRDVKKVSFVFDEPHRLLVNDDAVV